MSDSLFGSNEILNLVTERLDEIADRAKQLLLKPTETWSKPVEFRISKPDPYTRVIETEDFRYVFVSSGTKPHKITGKLAFQTTYSAKTTPGTLNSAAGGSSGGLAFATTVNHPGIDAREFPSQVVSLLKAEYGEGLEITSF